jgi:putative intracellular protease/amidase
MSLARSWRKDRLLGRVLKNSSYLFASYVLGGLLTLITARLLKNKTATGWKSLAVDIEDAGARYVDAPLVADVQYIFSRQPGDLGFFCYGIIRSLRGESLQPLAEAARAL